MAPPLRCIFKRVIFVPPPRQWVYQQPIIRENVKVKTNLSLPARRDFSCNFNQAERGDGRRTAAANSCTSRCWWKYATWHAFILPATVGFTRAAIAWLLSEFLVLFLRSSQPELVIETSAAPGSPGVTSRRCRLLRLGVSSGPREQNLAVLSQPDPPPPPSPPTSSSSEKKSLIKSLCRHSVHHSRAVASFLFFFFFPPPRFAPALLPATLLLSKNYDFFSGFVGPLELIVVPVCLQSFDLGFHLQSCCFWSFASVATALTHSPRLKRFSQNERKYSSDIFNTPTKCKNINQSIRLRCHVWLQAV